MCLTAMLKDSSAPYLIQGFYEDGIIWYRKGQQGTHR